MRDNKDILSMIRARSENLPPPKREIPIECVYFLFGVAVACMVFPPLFR